MTAYITLEQLREQEPTRRARAIANVLIARGCPAECAGAFGQVLDQCVVGYHRRLPECESAIVTLLFKSCLHPPINGVRMRFNGTFGQVARDIVLNADEAPELPTLTVLYDVEVLA